MSASWRPLHVESIYLVPPFSLPMPRHHDLDLGSHHALYFRHDRVLDHHELHHDLDHVLVLHAWWDLFSVCRWTKHTVKSRECHDISPDILNDVIPARCLIDSLTFDEIIITRSTGSCHATTSDAANEENFVKKTPRFCRHRNLEETCRWLSVRLQWPIANSVQACSTLFMSMYWLGMSPGHQQLSYWLWKVIRFFSFAETRFQWPGCVGEAMKLLIVDKLG